MGTPASNPKPNPNPKPNLSLTLALEAERVLLHLTITLTLTLTLTLTVALEAEWVLLHLLAHDPIQLSHDLGEGRASVLLLPAAQHEGGQRWMALWRDGRATLLVQNETARSLRIAGVDQHALGVSGWNCNCGSVWGWGWGKGWGWGWKWG